MAKLGYARVSTNGQNHDSQVDELTAYGCHPIYTDKVTGKLASRPEFDKCLAALQKGDVLVITRLSRAMRSLRHMLDLADELDRRGVGLKVLKQDIDTTTPTGRLVFHIFAAIDEWQRELIVESTMEGLKAAEARGRKGGRPPALDAKQTALARKLIDDGTPAAEVARMLKVSRASLYRAFGRSDS
ncbi:MAG: recombinase family protein [Streptosporangiaceae bacterium]|nr:recombinase family protein [Streptosporangiaceae bacterium]